MSDETRDAHLRLAAVLRDILEDAGALPNEPTPYTLRFIGEKKEDGIEFYRLSLVIDTTDTVYSKPVVGDVDPVYRVRH